MSNSLQSPAVPFSVACMGIAMFAGMDVLMKGLAIEVGAYNAMLWRTGISLLLASILFLWSSRGWPSVAAVRLHIWRGAVI